MFNHTCKCRNTRNWHRSLLFVPALFFSWLARIRGEGHIISIEARKSPQISKKPMDSWHQKQLHTSANGHSIASWDCEFVVRSIHRQICILNPSITDRTMLPSPFTHLYPWLISDCHAGSLPSPIVTVDSSIDGRMWAEEGAVPEYEVLAVGTRHCRTSSHWDYLHSFLASWDWDWIHSNWNVLGEMSNREE